MDTNGTEPLYGLETWKGWLNDYMEDQGTCYGADPKRVAQVGRYLETQMEPTRKYCLCWVMDALTVWGADATNGLNPGMVDPNGVKVGWSTLTDLMGYLGLRYENQKEFDP